MASYISGMPIWAITLFIAGFLYSIAFIANPAKQAALDAGMTPASARNIQLGIFGFYILYLAYASILALKGVFSVNSIPPKVMVFTAIPLTIILFVIYHLLPGDFAFSAGMGDIITAILALPVAKMVSKGKPGSLKIAYAWNIFGTLDIITLLVIAVINAKNPVVAGELGLQEMTIFPFVWFPAFAPATILFLHTTIFRKLQQIKAK